MVAVPNAFGAHPTPVPVGLPSGGVPTGKGCGYLCKYNKFLYHQVISTENP